MSIRRRIYRSYIVLIFVVLIYLCLYLLMSTFMLRIERENNRILEVKNLWGEMLVNMNESISNWNDGQTYGNFYANVHRFDEQLDELTEQVGLVYRYRGRANAYIEDLYNVWRLARIIVERIGEIRTSTGFLEAEQRLIDEPGLQRVYHVYLDLAEEDDESLRIQAEALKEYIGAVEFFPIYSSTANYHFSVIQGLMESAYARLRVLNNIISVMFFVIFVLSYIAVSGHFTDSLAGPIIQLSSKLNAFIGKSGAADTTPKGDELATLEQSVADLINHYTYLSRLAMRLARGHIETSLLDLPRKGIVGNALREIAGYLGELRTAATWIHEGKYGLMVEEQSEQDVLARSFNIMSTTIAEKINTLTNIFESIDEGIVLIEIGGTILEANRRFLNLLGEDDWQSLDYRDVLERFESDEGSILQMIETGRELVDMQCNLHGSEDDTIPVKLNSRMVETPQELRQEIIILVSNESVRVRMRREQERLKAQAVEAELRALRAQINPHFLFNTLNTIAYLVDTDASKAVETIEKLAEVFRYTLLSTKHQTVSLIEEMRYIQELMSIEAIRYGSRLTVEFDIDPEVEDWEIPPMVVQPIVENSIKHGVDSDGFIHIALRAGVDDGVLVLQVVDGGERIVDVGNLLDSGRTGLTNINQRLKTIYQTELIFKAGETGGLQVEMRIPKEGARA
ncbi:MAG: histidine kinase [Spirochaetaceae bacterium]|nr:histidine kinase [Spirochaetaceae bacterium]MDT8296667.1 histidine kinase [Spirochaetaceae bacterium]